jgi:hypothetical protein
MEGPRKKNVATAAVALSLVGGLAAYAYVSTIGSGTSDVATSGAVPRLHLSVPTGGLAALISGAPGGSVELAVTGTNESNTTLTLGSAPSAHLIWDKATCPEGSFTATANWSAPESVRAHRTKELDTTVTVTFHDLGSEQLGCTTVPITVAF